METRLAFLTIGQAPRDDLVPEIVRRLPGPVEIDELGALDGLGDAEVASLAPTEGEQSLVTRLADGRQVVVGKRSIHRRLAAILDHLDPAPYRATVLLCTGSFPGLRGRGFFLDAQHLMDHGVEAVCASARRVGLMVPLERQTREIHYRPSGGQELLTAHSSPYEGADLEDAARALSSCDVVAMHCMGYTEAQRDCVAALTGKPVLLARRLVAAALAQVV